VTLKIRGQEVCENTG